MTKTTPSLSKVAVRVNAEAGFRGRGDGFPDVGGVIPLFSSI
jgi:hypothetical protein